MGEFPLKTEPQEAGSSWAQASPFSSRSEYRCCFEVLAAVEIGEVSRKLL
jgi:hypothetical protein